MARASVVAVCAGAAPHLLDDAQLLVSELVTNAVRHGREPLLLEVDCDERRIEVAVHDASPELPAIRRPTRRSVGGRGMRLLQELAGQWGAEATEAGKRVWFRLT